MKKIRIDLNRCIGCRLCEEACAKVHLSSEELDSISKKDRKNWSGIKIQKGIKLMGEEERKVSIDGKPMKLPKKTIYPLRCRHCEDPPPCVEACITGGLTKEKSGVVNFDPEKCVGCWMCVMACPYGAIRRNVEAKTIAKCDMCIGREVPACVESCITDAIEVVEVPDIPEFSTQEIVEESG